MITPFNQKPIVKMIIQRGLFSRSVAIIKSKENLVLDFFVGGRGYQSKDLHDMQY